MASGRIESGGSLNLIIEWTSTSSSVTANLYLYNQYRITANTAKNCAITINGNTYSFTHVFGSVSAGTTTYLGSHKVEGIAASSVAVSGCVDIEITYNGSWIGRKEVSGTATLEQQIQVSFVNFYAKTINLDYAQIYYSTSASIDSAKYSLDGGPWIDVPNFGAWGNDFDLINLEPNRVYSLRIKATKQGVDFISNSLSFTTKDIARITQLKDFNFGDSIRIIKDNPPREKNDIEIKIENELIRKEINSLDDLTITFTQEELDKIYKIMNLANQITFTINVITTRGAKSWTSNRNAQCKMTGNAKTCYVVVDGVLKRAEVYIVENNMLKRAIVAVTQNRRIKGCL